MQIIPLYSYIRDCKQFLQLLRINFNRIHFEKFLRAALKNKFFNFEGKIYKQIGGVAMKSPLCPTLANAFLCFYEQISLNECPDESEPLYYRRYVDGII